MYETRKNAHIIADALNHGLITLEEFIDAMLLVRIQYFVYKTR